jgi:hypothetical protein
MGISMPPIRLTDSELDAVMAAARPIAVARRDAFLQEVATVLSGCLEVGPGLVHRVVSDVQRRHFDPPNLDGPMPRVSKWER